MKNNSLRTFLLLALLAAYPPLSTDMYLPAMPLLEKAWGQSTTMLNMTLSGFLLGFCFGMLLYGPISDRFGRKPPLIAGIVIYVIASFISGFVNTIYPLIVLRILQGVGAASSTVIAMAITKDLYSGHERQRILAYMGIIMALAPMSAPVIGGLLLAVLSWHWIFFAQTILGLLSLIGVLLMEEPLQQPSTGGVGAAMSMYLQLLRNRGYCTLVLLFSFIVWAPFAFIGSAKDIYMTQFGLSPQVFGYYFAFNALSLMAGSFACSQAQKRISSENLMLISFSGMLLGGIVLLLQISHGPWSFALPMGILSFFFGLGRPPSNHLVLEQVDHGIGAASSLMVFFYFVLGAFAAWFISLGWKDTIQVIAILAILTNTIALAGSFKLFKRQRELQEKTGTAVTDQQ
ncbi:multidrug effflux MFS transporter [Desulfobulbus rhabdoformis]|uniref:multidrug effflux MFS transporter n=1 Tax=Desulfobulbus rhabdoformis TaxID=34032 RepID=UPI0019633EB2|nr:multidrug effflux MFS transporter [Desulfobulbus rhabdoformis]MBM9616926.1 multidrug effflux MFS transporter [Desulfobulbus rhabdoformis]